MAVERWDTRSMGHGLLANRERDDNAAKRAANVYHLWLRGWSFQRIADHEGYKDKSAAYKAWKRARAAILMPDDLTAEIERERERLEIAYAGIAERVEQGDHWSIDRAVAIAERKAKLLGLDAKTDAPSTGGVALEIVGPLVNALRGQVAPVAEAVQE